MALKDGLYTYFKINTETDQETPAGSFELLDGSIIHIDGGVPKQNLELGPLTKQEEHVIDSINNNGYGIFKLEQQPEMMAQGGNAGEQCKKIFGTNAAPSKGSAMQEKHMEHIRKFAKNFLGLELKPSGGKIDVKTGERRSDDAEVGVDKPDWRSGELEAQANPDAMVHELAHLMLLPRGIGLKDGQTYMDKQYSDVQKNYGYMKQKQSQGEVQPMAAEQLLRRAMGLPANKNAVPVADPESPLRASVEDPTDVIGTRVKKGEKWVDLIRQSRFLTPENKQRIEDVLSKKVIFHHEHGWLDNPEHMGNKIRQKKGELASQHHFLFTPENPMHPSKYEQQPSIEDVLAHLKLKGEHAQPIKGKYGSEERSIMVHNPKDVEGLKQLSADLGQDSSILSKNGEHTAFFHHGPNAGMVSTGRGTQVHKKKPDDFYSEMQTEKGPQYFTHNINWDKKQKMAEGGEIQHFDDGGGVSADPLAGITFDQPAANDQQADPTAGITFDSDKYGTNEQMAKTALEGAATGVLGSTIATGLETGLGIATPEDIAGRKAENPWVHGGAQAAGLVGSAVAGIGAAPVLGAVGKGAAALTGLAESSSLAARVGSAAAASAAEMAVMEGDEEVSKMILKDPEASAQTAMANVGLAAALGGVSGAAMSGVISPLWKATAGKKTEQFLSAVKSHLNGSEALEMPEAVQNAVKELGIPIEKVMNSALSGNPLAVKHFNILRELEHPEIMRQLSELQDNAHKSILNSLGTNIDDVAVHSENQAGKDLYSTFQDELKTKYEPLKAEMDNRFDTAKHIRPSDESRRDAFEKMINYGLSDEGPGVNSKFYKHYEEAGQRLAKEETIAGLDRFRTELGRSMKNYTMDANERMAIGKIRNMVGDFQEQEINKAFANIEKEGFEHGTAMGRDVLRERAQANANYTQYRNVIDSLADHVGIGGFEGTGSLLSKMGDVTPEKLVKKFSPRGNVDAIPFLKEHFPDTYAKVQQNEAKDFLKASVYQKDNVSHLDMKKLATKIDNTNKTAPELVKFALPEDTLRKIKAAQVIQDAIPDYKSSKTAHWLSKLLANVPASVMAMIGAVGNHGLGGGIGGGIGGYAIGELMHRMGRDLPDAARLSLLTFLSADKPVNSAALHATTDFMHNVIKGDALLNKSVDSVFKVNMKGLPDFHVSSKDIAKLDRLVAQRQDNPNEHVQAMANADLGHYSPQHQVALSQGATQALTYLQQLKPKPFQSSPLDRKIEPSPEQNARYERALTIAQSPESVMEHVKNGTLQTSDIQDLNAMYPAVYKQMTQKLTNAMASHVSEDSPIPYHTRVSISLFLGQPMDSSMNPASILAAQPQSAQPPPQQQGGTKPKPTQLKGKSANLSSTPSQTAEKDRSNRD